jgi:hypothetical protein
LPLVLFAAVPIVLVGCRPQPSTSNAAVRLPVAPAAGHDSPRSAVAGFLKYLSSGDPFKTCGYVDPGQQGNCLSGFNGTQSVSGSWSVGGQIVRHHSALVVGLFDHFCVDGQCQTNADPRAGLPPVRNDFVAAFEQAQQLGKNSVVACVWEHGKWYVEGGVGLSPIPPT